MTIYPSHYQINDDLSVQLQFNDDLSVHYQFNDDLSVQISTIHGARYFYILARIFQLIGFQAGLMGV